MLRIAQGNESIVEPIQHEEPVDIATLEAEISDTLCTLTKLNWHYRANVALFWLPVLGVASCVAGFLFVLYRFTFHNYLWTLKPYWLNQTQIAYNNNTGFLYDWVKPYVSSYPGMNTSCGQDYPLMDVCTDLLSYIPRDIRFCLGEASANCLSNLPLIAYNLSQFPAGISNISTCGKAYPLNDTCQFVSLLDAIGGFKIIACAWSALDICYFHYEGQASILYPDNNIFLGSMLLFILSVILGIGLSALMSGPIIHAREVGDLSQHNKEKLFTLMNKINIEISNNNLLSTVKDALIAKRNTFSERYGLFSRDPNNIELKALLTTENESRLSITC